MRYIIVDTEGTGLFIHRNEDGTVRPSDALGQPRMAEFALAVLDDEFNVTGTYQQYVIPVGWENADGTPMLEMPPEAFAVHRLSLDFLREKGKPIEDALHTYTGAVMTGHVVVGFNQQHDGRQIRAELRRANMDDMFEQTPNICAMRSISTNHKGQVKKLNGKGGFPRLIDAASHFGIPYAEDKRHTALEDALVTAQVAKKLHLMGKLLPAAVHFAKDHSKDGEVS